MDADVPETVTMVSALPDQLVLSRLEQALPGSNDGLRDPAAPLGVERRGDEEPSPLRPANRGEPEAGPQASDAGVGPAVGFEAVAHAAGLEPIRVTGCPTGLLAELSKKAVERSLRVEPTRPVQVALVRPARLLRRVVELGQRAADLHLQPPIDADADGFAGADAAEVHDPAMALAGRLWRQLNLGRALILEEDSTHGAVPDTGGAPAQWREGALADDPLRRAIAHDRLPLLRPETTGVWHRVPNSLVVVTAGQATPEATADGLRRLLAEVRDAAFHVADAPAGTRALLRATFGSDPRVLIDDPPPLLDIPYLVHTSLTVPLTTEVVAALTQRSLRRDVSVVRVLLRDGLGHPGHLSSTRAAAVHGHTPGGHPPELASPVPGVETIDRIAAQARLEWVLPERVGLAPAPQDDGPSDLLAASGAPTEDELLVIGQLQEELAQEHHARERAEQRLAAVTADLAEQIAARERAEVQLSRRSVQLPLRSANTLGRVGRRLRR